MSERFKPKDIKNRAKNFLNEHKQAALKDHLPLAATIVSLGISAAEQDVRLGAITTATYLTYDKTKNKVHDALINNREKKLRKKVFSSFPDHLKKELIENDTETLIDNEEHFFAAHNKNLVETMVATEYFGVSKFSEFIEESGEEPEGDIDESAKHQPSDEIYKLSLPQAEINDFMTGMFHAQYILRANLRTQGKEFPDFSTTGIGIYNKDLFEATENLSEYFTQKEKPFLNDEGQETLRQAEVLLTHTDKQSQMALNGATYMIGLYDKQQWANDITERALPDSLPKHIKKDLAKMSPGEMTMKEYFDLIKDSVLEEHIIALEEPPGVSIVKAQMEDAPDGESTKEPAVSHLIAVHTDEYADFFTGVIAAHYLVRSLDGSPPQFSQDRINRHNLDLALASQKQEGGVYRHINEDRMKEIGQEKVEQLTTILASTGEDNDMSRTGGLYLLSLYTSQKEVDNLEALIPPENL